MSEKTLDQQYAVLVSDFRSFNQGQTNPAKLPQGFHKVVNRRGEREGFGFYCNACKLHVVAQVPDRVRHCGKVSILPTSWFKRLLMKTHKITR